LCSGVHHRCSGVHHSAKEIANEIDIDPVFKENRFRRKKNIPVEVNNKVSEFGILILLLIEQFHQWISDFTAVEITRWFVCILVLLPEPHESRRVSHKTGS